METPPLSLVLVRAADLGAKMVLLSHSEDSFVCDSPSIRICLSVLSPIGQRNERKKKSQQWIHLYRESPQGPPALSPQQSDVPRSEVNPSGSVVYAVEESGDCCREEHKKSKRRVLAYKCPQILPLTKGKKATSVNQAIPSPPYPHGTLESFLGRLEGCCGGFLEEEEVLQRGGGGYR